MKSNKIIKPPPKNAIEHKCHNCCAEYADGHKDCEVPTCALYAWMPYRKLEPDFSWLGWSSRRGGRYPVGTGASQASNGGSTVREDVCRGHYGPEVPSDDPT